MAGGRKRPPKKEKKETKPKIQEPVDESIENDSEEMDELNENLSIEETEEFEPPQTAAVKQDKVVDVTKKAKNPKKNESFAHFIHKVLKQVHPEIGISSKAMGIMNTFVNDMFERIANEGAALTKMSQRPTMSSREIQTSVKLLLPGNFCASFLCYYL